MPAIGSRKHAATAIRVANGTVEKDAVGFEFLGSGWSRNAYKGPDGVVYKVGYNYVNSGEVAAVQRILRRALHPIIRVPKATLWTVPLVLNGYKGDHNTGRGDEVTRVVAMEFIEGEAGFGKHENNWDLWRDLENVFGLTDHFRMNYIASGDHVYAIDLGEYGDR